MEKEHDYFDLLPLPWKKAGIHYPSHEGICCLSSSEFLQRHGIINLVVTTSGNASTAHLYEYTYQEHPDILENVRS